MTSTPVQAWRIECDGCRLDFEHGDFTIFSGDDLAEWLEFDEWTAEGGLHLCGECYATLCILGEYFGGEE